MRGLFFFLHDFMQVHHQVNITNLICLNKLIKGKTFSFHTNTHTPLTGLLWLKEFTLDWN